MKRLHREPKNSPDRMIAGVCGGIGNTYGIDPTVVRLATVLLCLIPIIIVVYIVGWIIIPEKTFE
jgi:phage shock protein C